MLLDIFICKEIPSQKNISENHFLIALSTGIILFFALGSIHLVLGSTLGILFFVVMIYFAVKECQKAKLKKRNLQLSTQLKPEEDTTIKNITLDLLETNNKVNFYNKKAEIISQKKEFINTTDDKIKKNNINKKEYILMKNITLKLFRTGNNVTYFNKTILKYIIKLINKGHYDIAKKRFVKYLIKFKILIIYTGQTINDNNNQWVETLYLDCDEIDKYKDFDWYIDIQNYYFRYLYEK